MIRDHSRAGWVGASDTHALMSSWDSKTFAAFMMEKLGLLEKGFSSRRLAAGTHWERRILDAIDVRKRDRQIRRRRLRLRVNLDGEDTSTVFEVKTHESEEFKPTRAYWEQCQVEHYATGKEVCIVAYRLLPEDIDNYYRELDEERLSIYPIEYDHVWIEEEYLPRLRIVARCIRRRRWPSESEIARFSYRRRRKADPVAHIA